ncbi:unnamed protein product [Arctogadus glacialis]
MATQTRRLCGEHLDPCARGGGGGCADTSPARQYPSAGTGRVMRSDERQVAAITGSGGQPPRSAELPGATTVLYWWMMGDVQYNHSPLLYNHSPLLVDDGRCPVQSQSSTGGGWEMSSTISVFYWWMMGDVQYNHSLLLVDAGRCPLTPQSSGGHWDV